MRFLASLEMTMIHNHAYPELTLYYLAEPMDILIRNRIRRLFERYRPKSVRARLVLRQHGGDNSRGASNQSKQGFGLENLINFYTGRGDAVAVWVWCAVAEVGKIFISLER
jgi:hypothetical protein